MNTTGYRIEVELPGTNEAEAENVMEFLSIIFPKSSVVMFPIHDEEENKEEETEDMYQVE